MATVLAGHAPFCRPVIAEETEDVLAIRGGPGEGFALPARRKKGKVRSPNSQNNVPRYPVYVCVCLFYMFISVRLDVCMYLFVCLVICL